ncbi:MAG: c-type cytochrome [Acidobacteria bacterium]|nr:c-type cytochrome [Acidobacteriota bacterium]
MGALVGCGTAPVPRAVSSLPRVGTPQTVRVPLGLPDVPVPETNPLTAEKIALGRQLYFDPLLSVDRTVSCASCHHPDKGFADGRRTALGVGAQTGTRSAPTVLNAAYSRRQFWDGRAASLEAQAGGPIANPIEMNLPHEVCVARLQAEASYRAAFQKAFGSEVISMEMVQQALASFERTLLSGDSPFDRFRYGGDAQALSPEAQRGLAVFLDPQKGNCASCHLIGDQHALLTDGLFHNIGIGADAEGGFKDAGRFAETQAPADRGAFKTPTLRQIGATAPYMHDGSLKTLRQVVDYYVGGGNSNPQLDRRVRPLELTGQERGDLVAFLESLSGPVPPQAGPPPAAGAPSRQ